MKKLEHFLLMVGCVLLIVWMVSVEKRISAQSTFNQSVVGYIESQGELNKAQKGLNEANTRLFKSLWKAMTEK